MVFLFCQSRMLDTSVCRPREGIRTDFMEMMIFVPGLGG